MTIITGEGKYVQYECAYVQFLYKYITGIL